MIATEKNIHELFLVPGVSLRANQIPISNGFLPSSVCTGREVLFSTREVWGGSELRTAQKKGFGATAINLQLSKHNAKWRFEAIIPIMGEGALSPALSGSKVRCGDKPVKSLGPEGSQQSRKFV